MGEKKKQNGGEQKEGKKEKAGDENSITVVLKTDLHCEGCASKLIKSIRSVDGVSAVTIGGGKKITVVGNVDPAELREKVEHKTHQKVELIVSPQPKNNGDSSKANGNSENKNKNEAKDKKSDDKSDQKKSKEKEPPETTAVLKVNLHCEGCVHKIHKTVTKTKGFREMKIDSQKDLVTVTGAMDMKALAESLQKQLKRDVEIISPKKESEKKEKAGGGGDEDKTEGNKMQAQLFAYPNPYPYPYPFMYGPGPVDHFGQGNFGPYPVGPYHAPQIFSDENPNACSVM
ncbi:heavy metal-associated isoprenylated plant protein 3-like [Andrographis paniculata]|uniref:heavy metal-associated isoprenylated plant protein 3-like n=1 Tax=Andrographis paniculata TaxID=175694 RepID=UPI0021E8F1B8|nr:heavy metal-associated isoprenylated plant protein 3-like [Andrographis paniculata]